MSQNFKVSMEMGYEFIVTANSQNEAMSKVESHLDVLLNQEQGYVDWVGKARKDIENSDYSIETYEGFVIV